MGRAVIDLTDQLACVEREITMRERLYPRWVQAQKMTQARADHEIAAMKAVYDTLALLRAKVTPIRREPGEAA